MIPSNDSPQGRHGVAYLLCGAAAISFSPVFVAVAAVGPTMAGFYRCLFGGLVLGVVVAVRRERLWAGTRPLGLAVAAAVLFAVDIALWHRAIGYVGPGLATLLGNFQVFLLAAFGILLLKESADWRFLASVPLAVGGLFLLVGLEWSDFDRDYRFGIFVGLSVAVAYAGYTLVLRRSQSIAHRLPPAANLMTVSFVVAAIMGPLGLAEGESFEIPDGRSWAAMVAYGVLCQALGWVLISKGLARVAASRAGLILLLQPALAFTWDVILFRRPTSAHDTIGVALTLAAIYLGTTAGTRR